MATETETSKNHENLQDCDLVMKGGATSGLVYPEAVLRLKGTHRFRSIGGTSAGALAAAVAAAAEYNRHGRDGGGFERLEELNRKLQGADGGGGQGQGSERPTYLRNLFQGSKATQPLLNIVQDMAVYRDEIRAIDTGSGTLPIVLSGLRLLRRIVTDSKVPGVDAGRSKGFWYGTGLAALLAAIIGILAGSWVGFGVALVVLGVIFALAGRWLGEFGACLLGLIRIVAKEVPRNYFGICNGRNDPDNTEYYKRGQPAITDWLHQSIQETAGRAVDRDVLTFADLEQPDASRPDGKKPNIKLAFMVTDISEGRPYVLPFDEPFIFREAEFRVLFPKAVVDRMTEPDPSQSPRYELRTIAGITLPKGFRFLPKGTELPVVVAARISQSFPLFFSSVPLYALPLSVRERIKGDRFEGTYAPGENDLIPHWFSDGGIASNFPIHFFDQWLPKSPTLGITLRYLPDYLEPSYRGKDGKRAAEHYLASVLGKDSERGLGRQIRDRYKRSAQGPSPEVPLDIVELPGAEDTVPLEWRHILYPGAKDPGWGAAFGFLWAVIKTMQNYRDNLQAGLPSYRERVAQVRLWPNEGGFNLAMETDAIKKVVGKGKSAGDKLGQQFNQKHHQWARLRVLIGELDAKFRKIREDDRFAEFEELVRQQSSDGSGYPYRKPSKEWCDQVIKRMVELRDAMDEWKKLPANVKLDGAGEPPPVLRVTPSV